MRSTPSADRVLGRLLYQLFSELARRAVAERLVRVDRIVQGGEITPIRSRNSRFSTRGIRGSGGLFMSMR
jgi:hypothetical protein